MKKITKAKVLNKRIKPRWLFKDQYLVTLQLIEAVGQPVVEVPASISDYYSMNIGEETGVCLYKHNNGKFYPYHEYY